MRHLEILPAMPPGAALAFVENWYETEAEIRQQGMQALIGTLGLVEAERFLMSMMRDRFDYTEWRRHELPRIELEELAQLANAYTKNQQ